MFDFGFTALVSTASAVLWGSGSFQRAEPEVRFEPLPPKFAATPPPLPAPLPPPLTPPQQRGGVGRDTTAEPRAARQSSRREVKRVIRERAPRYEPDRRVVDIPEAVDILINFMNEFEMYGLYAAHEIDQIWYDCCALERLVHMDPKLVREGLQDRKLKVGAKRLNLPIYLHIRERTGKDRLMLYRIPKRRTQTVDVPDDAALYSDVPDHNPATVPDHLALQPGDPAFLRPSARPPNRRDPGAPGVYRERERKVA